MKKTLSALTSVIGAVTLIYTGFVLIRSIPELARYMKIRAM